MKVLMLGWEFPPHLSGGLGTACHGLSTALTRSGVGVEFVLPRVFGGEPTEGVRLVDAFSGTIQESQGGMRDLFPTISASMTPAQPESESAPLSVVSVASSLSPYLSAQQYLEQVATLTASQGHATVHAAMLAQAFRGQHQGSGQYGATIFSEVERYATMIRGIAEGLTFDVIHAHDWMTFPAGVGLAHATGKPLVCHVHSLEYDRSGAGANERIEEIERFGAHHATKIIAVSYYTKSLLQSQYGVDGEKIEVVHNGVYPRQVIEQYRREAGEHRPTVLFLGRVTFQKGPDYFVEAAARIVPHVPQVRFVMAGTGDMLPRMQARVRELGIERHFEFPGFLKGPDVERMFSTADVYVMPSVSEPFGISALEAISFDTPVIISRQSGVAEVLSHALKVDFWDLDRMAELIINALVHEELRRDLVAMAREEVKRLRWDAAAVKTREIYRTILSSHR